MRRQVSVKLPDALLFQWTRLQLGIVAYVFDRKHRIKITHPCRGTGEHGADLRGPIGVCEVQRSLRCLVAIDTYLSPKANGRQLQSEQVVEPPLVRMVKESIHFQLIAEF